MFWGVLSVYTFNDHIFLQIHINIYYLMEQGLHVNGGRPLQMMKAPSMQDVLPNM
jgi:hypothetical protein